MPWCEEMSAYGEISRNWYVKLRTAQEGREGLLQAFRSTDGSAYNNEWILLYSYALTLHKSADWIVLANHAIFYEGPAAGGMKVPFDSQAVAAFVKSPLVPLFV